MERREGNLRIGIQQAANGRPMRTTTFILLSLFLSDVAAQHSGLGFKLAGQMANARSEVRTYSPVPGAAIGIYAPVWVGNRTEFQPELLLSAQGARFSPVESEVQALRSYYLQFPLSAKFYVSNVINLQAGAQGGYLLMADQHVGDEKMDMTDRLNRIDGGFNLGLGVDMISGWDITLRYYSALTPMLRNDTQIFPRNQVLHMALGYRFAQFSRITRKRR
jgi:hypothetical protein